MIFSLEEFKSWAENTRDEFQMAINNGGDLKGKRIWPEIVSLNGSWRIGSLRWMSLRHRKALKAKGYYFNNGRWVVRWKDLQGKRHSCNCSTEQEAKEKRAHVVENIFGRLV